MRLDISPPGRRLASSIALESASASFDIGQRLRAMRRERSWTLLKASQETKLSLSALSKIERGELSPTLSSLNKIAIGFGVDIVTLLDGQTPPNASGRRAINRRSSGTEHKTKT